VSLPSSAANSASSVRITGTSCCLYYAYNCAQDYFTTRIEQDEAQLPTQLNDHLRSVRCFNGQVPATCNIQDSVASQGEATSKRSTRSGTTGGLVARAANSLESGQKFTGGNHEGGSLTVTVEAVHYSGGNGIPGGIIYSGAQQLAADIYQNLGETSTHKTGSVEDGGVDIDWSLDTENGSGQINNLLTVDMCQSILSTILSDALEGMLVHGQDDIRFEVYSKTQYYNGYAGKLEIMVY
jgi:hypothetical protein